MLMWATWKYLHIQMLHHGWSQRVALETCQMSKNAPQNPWFVTQTSDSCNLHSLKLTGWHLQIDGWKTSLVLGKAYFQARPVGFKEGKSQTSSLCVFFFLAAQSSWKEIWHSLSISVSKFAWSSWIRGTVDREHHLKISHAAIGRRMFLVDSLKAEGEGTGGKNVGFTSIVI